MVLSRELLGFPRHLSQHVGGFVIAADTLEELVPVENAAMADRTVIQWDKDDLESLGLLKVDVLALGILTAIRKALQYHNAWFDRKLALATIPAEDPATYEMIQRADTIGVFQIESRAQMSMLPRLKPARFTIWSLKSRSCARDRFRVTWFIPIFDAARAPSAYAGSS
jgi:error-prone DNA polymerase